MMHALAIPFPEIDPIALDLGFMKIRWYGLAYMAGLILGWMYIRQLLRETTLWPANKPPFHPDLTDDLLIFITLGVIVGGRLGSVLFYEPSKYLSDPGAILRVWQGGMAFHGALIGCGVGAWAFARREKVSLWSTMDLCAAAVPIGLFFGRLANFINGELFGRPTDVAWGMVFPKVTAAFPQLAALEPTARHPSQLYEALGEGLILFLLLRVMTHHRAALLRPGTVIGTFLVGYGVARSIAELFRQPDPAHFLTIPPLTPGIAYSLPMISLGLYFLSLARTRTPR